MTPFHLLSQGSGDSTLADQLAALDGAYDCLRGAFAYVTAGGVRLMSQALEAALDSIRAAEWMVSFDYGVTTVGGLEALSALGESSIRIPSAERVLSDEHLRPTSAFHPKALWLMADGGDSIWLGSANLTEAGLSRNRELTLVAQGVGKQEYPIRGLDEWWAGQWEHAVPLDDNLVERYAGARDRVDAAPLSSIQEFDTPLPSEIHEASVLWAQVGPTQGGSDNQMDISISQGPFFFREPVPFDPNYRRNITLIHEGEVHDDRTAKYHQNHMTRIYLPTHTHGQRLEDIDNLREWFAVFRRVDDGTFELLLVPPGEDSLTLNQLREHSAALNQIETAGKRPVGWI